MKKVAIFVEGHTESIFVREFLLRFYDYNSAIECRTLFSDGNMNSAPYDFPVPDSDFHYQIINIGNDVAVLPRILKREKYMWNQGYDLIIGLRDMYSRKYRKIASGVIDSDVNQEFIQGTQTTIEERAIEPDKIKFCFSIMEVEAWFLGIQGLFKKLNSTLTSAVIHENTGFDLTLLDPETEFFHPATIMNAIYNLIGEKYDKKTGTAEALITRIIKEDYQNLLKSDKCASFNLLVKHIESNR